MEHITMSVIRLTKLETGSVSTVSTKRLITLMLGVGIYLELHNNGYDSLDGRVVNGYLINKSISQLPQPIVQWCRGKSLKVLNLISCDTAELSLNATALNIVDDIVNGVGDLFYTGDGTGRPIVDMGESEIAKLLDSTPITVSFYQYDDTPATRDYESIDVAVSELVQYGFTRATLRGELLLSLISEGRYRYMDIRCVDANLTIDPEADIRYEVDSGDGKYLLTRSELMAEISLGEGLNKEAIAKMEAALDAGDTDTLSKYATRIINKDGEMLLPVALW